MAVPELTDQASDIKSQYAAKIAADLERNTQDQQRISSQLVGLKDQLFTLQQNHSLLLNMQQSLTGTTPPSGKAVGSASEGKPAHRNGSDSPSRKAETRAPKQRQKYTRTNGSPTLRELVSNALAHQDEPRSAAEITADLEQSHPQRSMSIPVVRNTLEGLVAKGLASRTKQQKSVFYSSTDASTDVSDTSEKVS
ncbi:hypothetical protein [Streptomyces sp. NPDC056480]|uniref:hypothetical protein n=1 Tax=Streptomyces sp. NPDC056480 TaxID=3345833 RepID=UPI0036CD12BC